MAVSRKPIPKIKNCVVAIGVPSFKISFVSVTKRADGVTLDLREGEPSSGWVSETMIDSIFPDEYFRRVDETSDEGFYQQPRFVAHIDSETIGALTQFYSEFVPKGGDVLDLMSSWISHLPDSTVLPLGRVAGLGMNADELQANTRLTEFVVHNLNTNPLLEYDDGSFDRVIIAVSIQYLTRPVEVLRSVRRVLRSNGRIAIAMSHRCFPTKAIAAFQSMDLQNRMRLVSAYLDESGFEDIEFFDHSPAAGDPLWIVVGTRPELTRSEIA